MTLDTKAIEAELAAITQGKWETSGNGLAVVCLRDYKGGTAIGIVAVCRGNNRFSNDTFIAHAPAHVRNLIDRVKELEEEIDELVGQHDEDLRSVEHHAHGQVLEAKDQAERSARATEATKRDAMHAEMEREDTDRRRRARY